MYADLADIGWSPGTLQQLVDEEIPKNYHSPNVELQKSKRRFGTPIQSPSANRMPKNLNMRSTPSSMKSSQSVYHRLFSNFQDEQNDHTDSHFTSKPSSIKTDGGKNEVDFTSIDLDAPLPNGWLLFPHQKEAIQTCLTLRRTILAFDMGLGKTVISLSWAKAMATPFPHVVTVIIAPCTLMEVWQREAEMLGFTVLPKGNARRNLSRNHVILIMSWCVI